MAHDFPVDAQKWLWLAFFASFAVKMPMWPVHTWLPDAHVQAPTAGSVILAGVLLKMGGYGFIRFSLPMFPEGSASSCHWFSSCPASRWSTPASSRWCSSDMKKLIAYSSVAHMAFVTFGLFAMNRQGIEGAMMVMLGHGLVSGALFLCVGVVYDRLHTREIAQYGGLSNNMPGYALLFMIFTMASVGLPGTSNFVGEFLSLVGTYKVSTWAAIVATTGIILGAAYMLLLYWRICFGVARTEDAAAMTDLSLREWWLLAPIAAGVFWMGIYPGELHPARSARTWPRRAAARARSSAGDSHLTAGKPRAAHAEHGSRGSIDEPVRTHPARADPDHRRHRPDDGRGLRRAAQRRPRRAGLAVAVLDRCDSRSRSGRRTHAGPSSAASSRPTCSARSARRSSSSPSAVAIIAAHGWFERETEHGAEYSVLILFTALGGAVMVSATSLVTLYVGLELSEPRRATCWRPIAARTSARPRRASNISFSARSRAASCFTASRCSTASPGR